MRQFNRQFRLDIGDENDGISINNLRVEFSISKTIDKKPNPAQIKIWNLNQSHREQLISLQFKYLKLFVGYDRLNMIYAGNIKTTKVVRDGLDILIELECADGDVDYRNSFISRSLASGCTDQHIIQALSDSMKNTQPGSIDIQSESSLPRGKVLHGASRDLLSDIAIKHNADWSIQDGELVFLPNDRFLNKEITVLSQETGMIGSPLTSDKDLEVCCLLNPQIQVGSKVRIESIESIHNGDYKVISVLHQGDAIGGDWKTTLRLINKREEKNE
ncbi:phage protein [Pragia fontium]|uniref:phage protein n=1 Tax=Pragia fontium TaxID=82985 RepID=UPI000649E0FD|nr:hypothetical protein [Pragia fontium]AKJ42826.1 hypothetical protein QQ39_12675 [Pragia fontium]